MLPFKLISLPFVLNILVSTSAQLSLPRLLKPPNSTFILSPILFGECDRGKCGNETSPYFGGRDAKVAEDQLERCEYKTLGYSEYFGSIELDRENYCDPRTMRGVPGRTCCFPQMPTADFPRMHLYPVNASASGANAIHLDWRNASDSSKLPQSGKVVMLVHGWTELPLTQGSIWIYAAIEAWTKVHQTPVIVVEYTNTSNYHYFQNAANARLIGQALGYAIINWQLADRLHLVGFSLGGQIIGEVGRYTQGYGQPIKECVALDPAGPGFDGGSSSIRITPDDCQLVQTIHSSSESIPDSLGVITLQLGTYYPTGSCDFWINCGRRQAADCLGPTLGATMNNVSPDLYYYSIGSGCSHFRAPLIYSASVAGKCKFTGYECINCNDFRLTTGCRVNFQGERMQLPPFNTCKTGDRKDFYVQTLGNNYPYCPTN